MTTDKDALVKRLHEEVAQYGVDCSKTKELAPRTSMVAVFKEIEALLTAPAEAPVAHSDLKDRHYYWFKGGENMPWQPVFVRPADKYVPVQGCGVGWTHIFGEFYGPITHQSAATPPRAEAEVRAEERERCAKVCGRAAEFYGAIESGDSKAEVILNQELAMACNLNATEIRSLAAHPAEHAKKSQWQLRAEQLQAQSMGDGESNERFWSKVDALIERNRGSGTDHPAAPGKET